MEHIKMAVSEEKGETIYKFSYGYVARDQALTFVPDVITAHRKGNNWTFDFNETKAQDANQLETYRKTLDKVNQVMETNAANLMGIVVEKIKPAAK